MQYIVEFELAYGKPYRLDPFIFEAHDDEEARVQAEMELDDRRATYGERVRATWLARCQPMPLSMALLLREPVKPRPWYGRLVRWMRSRFRPRPPARHGLLLLPPPSR